MSFKNRIGLLFVAVSLLAASSTNARAQEFPTRMNGLALSVFGGGAAFSDLQRSSATAEWPIGGGNLRSRDFERRVSPATSPAFAASAAYWPSPWWGVRMHAGLSPSRLEVTVSERQTSAIPGDSAVTGSARYASLQIWSYDAAVLFRLPITPRGRIAPYGFIGAGALRYVAGNEDSLPTEARGTFENQDDPKRIAATFGVGALVPLRRRNLALSFELTDHLARTPIRRPSGGSNQQSGVTVVMDPDREPAGEGRVRNTNHVRLLVGLTVLLK